MKIKIVYYCMFWICFLHYLGFIINAQACLTQYSNADKLTLQHDEFLENTINAWVVDNNVKVYHCFNNSAVKKKLKFRSRYHIVNNNYKIKYKDKYWSLLAKGNNVNIKNIIGWISHENIIERNTPLRNQSNGIFQKVLIKEGDRNQLQALQVFKSKHLLDTKEGIEVRTIFYVYDFYPRTALSPESKDTKSLLIGVFPQLNTSSDNALSLIGWIDRKNVSFWNSRTACEFPVGVKSIVCDGEGKSLVETFLEQPLNYNELRNPILKDLGDDFLIGAFMRLSNKQITIRNNIDKIRTGLEVLFVIDGTRSMTAAFQGTLDAVRLVAYELIKQSKNNQLSIPRFGLVFYRDKPNRPPRQKIDGNAIKIDVPYCKEEYTVFNMSHPDIFDNNLSSHVACDSDNSIRESMYMGLFKGVQKCGFLSGFKLKPKCMRVIIHIGDAGDNGRGSFSPEDISLLLSNYHIFRYISIDVSVSPHQSQFSKDVEKIQIADKLKCNHLQGFKGLSNVVKNLLENYHKKTIELQAQIKIISKGFAGTSKGQTGIFSSELLSLAKKIISAHNIDLKDYDAFQQYVVGKVPKTSDLKKYLLVSLTDLEKISSFLTDLIETAGDINKRKNIWESSLKLIIGDDACVVNGQEISLEACNQKRKGIPIKAGFMKYTKSQFLNLSGNVVRRIHCEARILREKFRAFSQDKYINKIIVKDFDTCQFQPFYEMDINSDGIVIHSSDTNQRIDKYYFQEGGESMAWIPIEQFNFTIE
ncbi:hypothetical protein MHK_004338 [Candidatus Magnetomorum sp. HK-1]|nr:hypothetical protein MHK_004338 [Candidatus Magnetomorum sp. HK-1]